MADFDRVNAISATRRGMRMTIGSLISDPPQAANRLNLDENTCQVDVAFTGGHCCVRDCRAQADSELVLLRMC